MSGKDEKEFAEQAERDREFLGRVTDAEQRLKHLMQELDRKHKGNEKKVKREFLRLCREDPAVQDDVMISTFEDLWRKTNN